MKKILVAVADYPDNNDKVTLMYVHNRNIFYKNYGYSVTVLNFNTHYNYIIDEINVISYKTYKKNKSNYDILICHAANIRNHYYFLKRFEKYFKHIVFFYHGHEVLKVNRVYSKPYPYVNKSKIKIKLIDIYDNIKLILWKKYLPKIAKKSDFIFVSKWMLNQFLLNINMDLKEIKNNDNVHITYNGIGKIFEKESYDDKSDKEFDFITIRSNLDGSKYCIDVVNQLAKNTPECKFLLIGKGNFFNHYRKSDNLIWIDTTLQHKQIIEYLNKSRFALMPTRTDAQGLMMCEMAAFGIPVITSDIEVCHEIFENFKNVWFIDNEDKDLNLKNFINIKSNCIKDSRYFFKKTIIREIEILNKLVQ